jgi:hypothetical protein
LAFLKLGSFFQIGGICSDSSTVVEMPALQKGKGIREKGESGMPDAG